MKKWVVIVLHVAVWLILLTSNMWTFLTDTNKYVLDSIASSGLPKLWYSIVFNIGYQLIELAGFYGCFFLVAPILPSSRKYVKAIIYFLLTLAAMVLIRYLVEFQLFVPYLKFHNYFWRPVQPGWYIWNCIVVSYKYCLLGAILYFILKSYKIEKEKKESEKEKIHAELSFLRSQVNPHFLFNTINDIYTLTYQKSDAAPGALLKLSEILRYMLDGGTTEKVLLQKELQYLNSYIELQAIGLKNNIFLDFTVTGNVNEQQIAPLLLIPFVENIFKHGVIDDAHRKAAITIQVNENNFSLVASNYIKKQQKDSTGGIGLKNVKRRLELLYPGRHNFTIREEEDTFTGLLQIDLSDK